MRCVQAPLSGILNSFRISELFLPRFFRLLFSVSATVIIERYDATAAAKQSPGRQGGRPESVNEGGRQTGFRQEGGRQAVVHKDKSGQTSSEEGKDMMGKRTSEQRYEPLATESDCWSCCWS